jgi:predicted phosphodiesterase
MDIQIFSDFHGEAYMGRPDVIWSYVTPMAEIAVVAGDIDARNFEATVNEIATKFKHVVCLAGNHEWYRWDISWRPDSALLSPNVYFLDRSSAMIEGNLFAGATLWTDFKNQDWHVMHSANHGINDFRVISNGNKKFSAADAYELHLKDRGYLEAVIDNPIHDESKLIIVTHFLPSYELVHPKWKGLGSDMLNYYFSCKCDDLIEKSGAAAWIFGHTHDRRDEVLYDVRCVCNPIGYPRENPGYQDMVITI